MGGKKFHLLILLVVLLSICVSEGESRLSRRRKKKLNIVGTVVGAATRGLIRSYLKPKTTKAPQIAIFMPAVAAYPNQPYYQQPLGSAPPQNFQPAHTFQMTGSAPPQNFQPAHTFQMTSSGNPGQFNQTGQFNRTNSGAPAYGPNSIFPNVPRTPVQYPVQPNGVQPVGPFLVITNSQPTPRKNQKSSASTFSYNSGYFGLVAVVSCLMVTGNRLCL